MKRAACLGVCALLVAQAGCYAYAPLRTAPEGTAVRVRVTAEEATRLSAVLGREARVLVGRVAGEENGGLLLQVRSVANATGGLYQRVTILPAALVELEERRLDRVRTGGLVAAVAALAVYTYFQFEGDTAGEGSREPPGRTEFRIPFVIPL